VASDVLSIVTRKNLIRYTNEHAVTLLTRISEFVPQTPDSTVPPAALFYWVLWLK
jgi:hypothetical protein